MITRRVVKLSYVSLLLFVCLESINASVSDQIPGYKKETKAIFKKLLTNYNPLLSPKPNDRVNVSLYCRHGGSSSYNSKTQQLKLKMHMTLRWDDQRLRWNSSKVKSTYLRARNYLYRLWLPRIFSVYVTKVARTSVAVMRTGRVYYYYRFSASIPCSTVEGTKYPVNAVVCNMYFSQEYAVRLRCNGKGKEGDIGCCLKRPRYRNKEMWKIQKIRSQYYKRSGLFGFTRPNIHIFLQRNTAENHFFINPIIIIGFMSAVQCLISLTTSRRHFLTCVLILAAIDCAVAISEMPIIRQGGGSNLANMSGMVVGFNIIFLIWSCVSSNFDRSGGMTSSVTKLVVEKADRYRLFFLLPSHVEVAESKGDGDSASWAYFSLIVDRILFVIYIFILMGFAIVSV